MKENDLDEADEMRQEVDSKDAYRNGRFVILREEYIRVVEPYGDDG